MKERITIDDFIQGKNVSAPEALELLFKEMKKEWKAVEIEFARATKLVLFNPENGQFAGSVIFEKALYVSFPKRDRLVAFGRYYYTKTPVCSILAFPLDPEENRDAISAKEKILYCGKDYPRSIVLYANDEEIFANSHHYGERLSKGLIFAKAEYGIRADSAGGFEYNNPEVDESFSEPMLRALEAVLNK